MPAQMANDFGVDPWDRFEFAGPIGAVVWPGEPGGGMGLPFGGHAVTEIRLAGFHGCHGLGWICNSSTG
jgi:hypothetical protein